jgi:hypothetical protein
MTAALQTAVDRWRDAWPAALAAWGTGLRLQPPILLTEPPPHPADSFAWFELAATTVTIDLTQVESLGLLDLPVPVLAHEIGHHVYAPADYSTSARLVARCAKGLVDRPLFAGTMANIWSDTLINDRLQRQRGLPMDAIYRAMPVPQTALFLVWFRAYELLWGLPSQSLTRVAVDGEMATDALLLSRHVRAFAREPVDGAAGFAALMRRWLPDNPEITPTPVACQGHGVPASALDAVALDDSLDAPVVHPALDPRVNPEAVPTLEAAANNEATAGNQPGQGFGPARLTEVYGALHMDRDAAEDWYIARAAKYLIPFPAAQMPTAPEEEPLGWEPWAIGEEIDDVDWLASVLHSPQIVPGLTTRKRTIDRERGTAIDPLPLDLDLYVDSSGSMPNPRRRLSPSVLAGVVIALSALRAGARVQVTVWSGPGQVARTGDGFTRDRHAVVQALLHFFGGGTSFPLADLARDHPPESSRRTPWQAVTHICVISDWGVTSMFGQGQPPGSEQIAHTALVSAGGGGSLILNESETNCARITPMTGDYAVYPVPREADLPGFAGQFATQHWGAPKGHRPHG